jgi:hypothetical protein
VELRPIAFLRACIATNDRETGKNCKCAAIMIVFRQNPGVV